MSEEERSENDAADVLDSEVKFHSDELDHGFFQLTLPHSPGPAFLWFVAVILLSIALTFYIMNLDTVDVVPVDEAIKLDNPEQPHELKQLGLGFEEGEKGAWLYLEGLIIDGKIATLNCVQDDEGDWSLNTEFYDEELTIQPVIGTQYQVEWTERTWGPEMNAADRDCPSGDSPWTIETNATISMLVLDDGEKLWLISVGEGDNPPPEVTDREDGQRWAMVFAMLGCGLLMVSTPTSLSRDLNKYRNGREARPIYKYNEGILATSGSYTRSIDDYDWVLPPPKSTVILEDPWASGPEEELIPEHPKVIGTPIPATITFYSIAAMGFVIFTIWLSSDLLARHGGGEHVFLGNFLRYGIILFTLIWLWNSYRNWKFINNLRDTPTSTVRSIAVGAAEVVGQALPMPSGTLTAKVGKHKVKEFPGCLSYSWTEEEETGSGKNKKWVVRAEEEVLSRFIAHDGTGGIIIEPDTFEDYDWGSVIARWGSGKWRWAIEALTVFDPIYCLGRVEKRDADDLADCPSESSVQHSLLVVRGNKDVGMQAKLTRGTELSLLKRTRSTFELLIVPILMAISAAIPFIW